MSEFHQVKPEESALRACALQLAHFEPCGGNLLFRMKPARGSRRASTRGPRRDTHTADQTSKPRSEAPEPLNKHRATAMTGKSKNKANWKPLTKSTLLALENMLGLSMLSALALKSKEKEESQKHLNLLKDQFLAKCAQLSVPPRKPGDIMHVSHQFRAERKKSEHGRKTLEALEENMSLVVGTLEEMEVQMDGLEEKCRIMRRKLEEEEDKAHEFLQLSEQTVLCLPALPSRPASEPTLQEHLMKTVPDPPAVVRALRTAPVLGDVRVFLELAHKQVDSVQAHRRDTALD
ncbi:centromere protein Q [Carassius carassius]|uniref:centromere protein Q n=1 Tax=Carassius carassius TaxID=217509 RepID=UPI002868E973|nr:centromere protein Q [Carassius carassius]